MRVALISILPSDCVNAARRTVAECGHDLVVHVTTRYHPPGKIDADTYLEQVAHDDMELPIVLVGQGRQIAPLLSGLDLDLVLVCGFPLRLPPETLALPRLGCVNVHPSLLPRYRGFDPIGWQLLEGETHMGMTFHRMEPTFDSGPVLLQWQVPIALTDNRQSLRRRVGPLFLERLPELLDLVASGAPGTPQDSSLATPAPMFSPRELTLDWQRPAAALVNQVRAVGDGGAAATLEGHSWRIVRAEWAGETAAPPGTVLEAGEDWRLVATGDGALRVAGPMLA